MLELLTKGMVVIDGEAAQGAPVESAVIWPYARWHAGRGDVVTNAMHHLVKLTPEQARRVRSGEQPDAKGIAELMDLGLLF